MKYYRVIKDLPFAVASTIFNEDGYYVGCDENNIQKQSVNKVMLSVIIDIKKDGMYNYSKYIELVEIKKENKPKFKVGDYVVYEDEENRINSLHNIEYIKIYEISVYEDGDIFYNGNKEECYRIPTQQELNTYFR